MPEVTMYSSAWCPYSTRARVLLREKGVEVRELVVDGDPELRREMERRSGRVTVPQIFLGERHIGGCDDLYELDRRHDLDALLTGA